MSSQIRLPALLLALLSAVACGDGAMPLAPEASVAAPAASQPLLQTHAADAEFVASPERDADGEATIAATRAESGDVAASETRATDVPVRDDAVLADTPPFTWLFYPPPLLSGYMLSSGRKAQP
jgi:hypothetical protein